MHDSPMTNTRKAAIAALAEALDYVGWGPDLRGDEPGATEIADGMGDYLDAKPPAKAALAAWLNSSLMSTDYRPHYIEALNAAAATPPIASQPSEPPMRACSFCTEPWEACRQRRVFGEGRCCRLCDHAARPSSAPTGRSDLREERPTQNLRAALLERIAEEAAALVAEEPYGDLTKAIEHRMALRARLTDLNALATTADTEKEPE